MTKALTENVRKGPSSVAENAKGYREVREDPIDRIFMEIIPKSLETLVRVFRIK